MKFRPNEYKWEDIGGTVYITDPNGNTVAKLDGLSNETLTGPEYGCSESLTFREIERIIEVNPHGAKVE